MKLTSIKLCNFRSFYGTTPEINLAVGENHNTTIIHGNNGAGKTSLLNAFTWVLYEKFTAAFASTEQLVNKRSIAEAPIGRTVECWVEIGWEHEGKRYLVRRSCKVHKNHTDIESGKTELTMWICQDDGKWGLPTQQPDDIINQILPATLHQYFFFDGERIEEIVRSDKKAEIAEATKIFLGVEVINRSLRHLGEAKKNLESELKSIGNPATKQLLQKQEKLEAETQSITKRQIEITQELEHQQTIKKETSNRLIELVAAQEIQERWKSLESQKNENQQAYKKNKAQLKKIISNKGYTVLLSPYTTKFREIIEDLKQKGQLKVGISQEFINQLLTSQQCICGADLSPGTVHQHHIKTWIDKAGSSVVEEIAIRMSAQVDEIDKQAASFWEEVDIEQGRIQQLRQAISNAEEQLDSLQEKLRQDANEEISNLQKRLDIIESKIHELNREQGANERQIINLQTEIDNLGKQLSKQQHNQARQTLAQRRINATQDAIERLTEMRKRQEKQFRLQLEKRVQEIFNQISVKPYIPQISEKYELTLIENTAGIEAPVAASTGENQILSLSFIASIIDKVREWSQKRKMIMLPDSSTFPIVMDSPFGSLDEMSRRHIAATIPKLANQLIVLVTKTQWRGEVEAEMRARIGREYVLIYYSSKLDCEQDYIQLGKQKYPLVKQSPNEFEYTQILEVSQRVYE